MTAGEICVRDVIAATAETTVTEAAKLMRRHHVGSVVVVDKMEGGLGRPLGIVTDRDIVVEVTATELDADTITIGDIMPDALVAVSADEGLFEIMHLMRLEGVRRLPVVTGEGQLIGLVAFDDLLELVTEQLSELTRIVGREQAREAQSRKSYGAAV